MNSVFLVWIAQHFGENAQNAWLILGCLHQILLLWIQFRMSRFSKSLEIDDGGDDRLKRINVLKFSTFESIHSFCQGG